MTVMRELESQNRRFEPARLRKTVLDMAYAGSTVHIGCAFSIIELLAGAIDAKSPYTSGHCQRVPALTEMLAHAAEDATAGPFKNFHLSEEQWEELHIAGWLHDCGKLTSPEFVIDKATKLETIYDRLHEVRMRFEVIKREAEAACWREIAESGLAGDRRADHAPGIERGGIERDGVR